MEKARGMWYDGKNTMNRGSPIIRLRALEKQLYAYRYALNVVDFDAETIAPEGGADGRAEATEVLSRASFDLLVNDATAAIRSGATASMART